MGAILDTATRLAIQMVDGMWLRMGLRKFVAHVILPVILVMGKEQTPVKAVIQPVNI